MAAVSFLDLYCVATVWFDRFLLFFLVFSLFWQKSRNDTMNFIKHFALTYSDTDQGAIDRALLALVRFLIFLSSSGARCSFVLRVFLR